MTESAFVGRADIMAQVLGGRTSMFFDVEGIPGIGKTALLDQLAKLARPEDAVIRIDGEFFEAHRGRARDEDADLGQFRRLLRGALKSLPDDEKITDVLNYLSDYSSSTQGVQRADFVHDSDEILERAIAAANHIGSALAETQARFLVLVDDFHLLAGRPIGQWVMTWLAAVRGADVVLAHQEYGAAEDFALPARAVRLKLGNLSREDVKAYLKSHPDIGPDVDGIVGYVWDFTGGYPDALALVADLIKGSGDRDNAVRLVQQLVALQGGRAAQLEALVNRILDMIHDEELRDTLYKVCVTRHFDVPLVELLMKVDDLRAQTLIERLMHYSFVRKNTGEHSFYAVSDFVRRIGEERLGPDRTQKTHDVAEGYYHKLVDREVEDDESSYQRWFRYEQPEFQALERDWLYHLSRLTGNRRRTGRISIAKIFLDAFWWWGSYIPFRFCEQILADWAGATLDDDEDLAWGTLLRTVYNRYPKGWRKADTPADQWTEVRLALRHLMDRGVNQARLTGEERDVRGILDFYLADVEFHTSPHSEEADELLNDAEVQFEALDDEWNAAWVEFCRADLAVARGQAELAISIAKDSAGRHPDLEDDELVANLHRVCADAHWLGRELGKALDAHARAVLHAYRFQVKDVQDDYTEAFQREMTDRAVERLAAWRDHASDSELAGLHSACARIRALFSPYWRAVGASPLADGIGLEVVRALDEGRMDDVAGMLFPALPTVLGYPGTPYALTCGDVTHTMRGELAKQPDSPLQPAET